MGLPHYHKIVFSNKRFVSIVLFENIPQLIIQILTLKLLVDHGDDALSDSLITILSMIFTIISIILSIFEYLFSSKSIKNDNIMIISFTVLSKYFGNMSEGTFLFKVIFRPRKIRHIMYRLLKINRAQIERLIPLQLKNGVIFTFFVEMGGRALI